MSGQNPTVIEASKMVAEAQQFVAGYSFISNNLNH